MRNQYTVKGLLLVAALVAVCTFLLGAQFAQTDQVTSSNPTFSQSTKSAKLFYEWFRKAHESIIDGDYDQAIHYLEASLPHAGMALEESMVYDDLIGIYRDMGDYENELKYIQKQTMPPDPERIQQLRILLSDPLVKDSDFERYPSPPIYGRSFKNYREVVAVREKSKDLWRDAEVLYRKGEFRKSIAKLKEAYVPNWTDNCFIETLLIDCYEKTGEYKKALTLIDYTLKTRSWGPTTIAKLNKQKNTITAHMTSAPSNINR